MKINFLAKLSGWKLSTRLITLFVLLGLVPFLTIGGFLYYQVSEVIHQNVNDRLLLADKNRRIVLEQHFKLIHHQLLSFSKDLMVIQAMDGFKSGFILVEEELGDTYNENLLKYEELLKKRYVEQRENTVDAIDNALEAWWPKTSTARILQHYYISANPYENHNKRQLDFSLDGSFYSLTHREYHPTIKDYAERFGFHDILLVDVESGNLVYSIEKNVDFATNLKTGPYQDSPLARVFQKASESDSTDMLFFEDFSPYAPDYNHHVLFIGTPIFETIYGEVIKVGVLIFELQLDKISSIMSSHDNWDGEGETGESYLIGPDHLFRTDSRFRASNPLQFAAGLRAAGSSDKTIKTIQDRDSLVGILKFQNTFIDDALNQKSGISEMQDYQDKPVIFAYAPVQVLGNTWAIISSIHHEEAFSVLYDMREAIGFLGGIITLLVLAIGWGFARSISEPLNQTIAVISSSSTEIATTISEQERLSLQQESMSNQLSTTIGELGVSSQQTAQQAQDTAHSTETIMNLTHEGSIKVNEMLQSMSSLKHKVTLIAKQITHLSEQTNQIGNITALVTDFANETKMLAMNAAVEAVRAGEHGKGFSVLSVEIRKLADESKRSAERINVLVDEVKKATNSTVMATDEGTKTVDIAIQLAQETASTFDSVSESISDTTKSTQQISLNIQQQAEAINQGLDAMKGLAVASKESAAGIAQTRLGIKALESVAFKLKSMV